MNWALLATGAAGLSLPLNAAAATETPPNILFILTDDHRWDALSILGHPVVETPNLDRLCREGVRFENAFVTTSLCSPSRASFLTGQYASVHGIQNNFSRWDPDKDRTFFCRFTFFHIYYSNSRLISIS